jgi:putative transposase
MKTSRFTDSQIIAVLKQAEAGTPVPELCREHGVSSATEDVRRGTAQCADLLKEAMQKKW